MLDKLQALEARYEKLNELLSDCLLYTSDAADE